MRIESAYYLVFVESLADSCFLNTGWKIDRRSCVPDDMDKIQEVLLKWSDEDKLQASSLGQN